MVRLVRGSRIYIFSRRACCSSKSAWEGTHLVVCLPFSRVVVSSSKPKASPSGVFGAGLERMVVESMAVIARRRKWWTYILVDFLALGLQR